MVGISLDFIFFVIIYFYGGFCLFFNVVVEWFFIHPYPLRKKITIKQIRWYFYDLKVDNLKIRKKPSINLEKSEIEFVRRFLIVLRKFMFPIVLLPIIVSLTLMALQ